MKVKELIEKLQNCNQENYVRCVDEEKESFFIGEVKDNYGICWLFEEE